MRGDGEKRRRTGLAGVLLLVAMLLLAACGDSSTPPTAATTTASPGGVTGIDGAGSGTATATTTITATTTATAKARPQPTATPIAIPASVLAHWRLAYMAGDGHLHQLTLDGKSDRSSVNLPDMDFFGLDFASAGISSDGHTLAYSAATGLTILDVTQNASRSAPDQAITQMVWSPDGSTLALGDGLGGFWTASATASVVAVPATPSADAQKLLGWLDATHLVVTKSGANVVTLSALDITSGALRAIATVSAAQMGTARLDLSPDGKWAIFSNVRFRADPYTPLVALINTATGAVTKLSGITQATGSGFTSAAWQPGTETLAVSTGSAANGNVQAWLLDAQHDTAARLTAGAFVAGWVPGSRVLLLSTSNELVIGEGPHAISALVLDTAGHYTAIPLTKAAYGFPIVGILHM